VRPRIQPAFGWLNTIAWIRNVQLRGLPKVDCCSCSPVPPSTGFACPRCCRGRP